MFQIGITVSQSQKILIKLLVDFSDFIICYTVSKCNPMIKLLVGIFSRHMVIHQKFQIGNQSFYMLTDISQWFIIVVIYNKYLNKH
jgi:hypothetical protein